MEFFTIYSKLLWNCVFQEMHQIFSWNIKQRYNNFLKSNGIIKHFPFWKKYTGFSTWVLSLWTMNYCSGTTWKRIGSPSWVIMVTLVFLTLSKALQQKTYLKWNCCTGPRALEEQEFTSELKSDSVVGAINYQSLLTQWATY